MSSYQYCLLEEDALIIDEPVDHYWLAIEGHRIEVVGWVVVVIGLVVSLDGIFSWSYCQRLEWLIIGNR